MTSGPELPSLASLRLPLKLLLYFSPVRILLSKKSMLFLILAKLYSLLADNLIIFSSKSLISFFCLLILIDQSQILFLHNHELKARLSENKGESITMSSSSVSFVIGRPSFWESWGVSGAGGSFSSSFSSCSCAVVMKKSIVGRHSALIELFSVSK